MLLCNNNIIYKSIIKDKRFFKIIESFCQTHFRPKMTIQLWKTKNFIYLNKIIDTSFYTNLDFQSQF